MIYFIMGEHDVIERTFFQRAQMFLRYTTRQYSIAHTHTVDSFLNIIAVVYRSRLSWRNTTHSFSFCVCVLFLSLHLRNSSPTESLLLSLSSFFSKLWISLFPSLPLVSKYYVISTQ